DEAANARVAGLELHARQAVHDGARARQAVALEMHAEEAELRELLRELARQDRLLEPLADLGEDAVAYELAHGVADRALLVVQEGVDREEVARVEARRLRRGRHGRNPSARPPGGRGRARARAPRSAARGPGRGRLRMRGRRARFPQPSARGS